jgi:CubicO group peptidase (beta-lactamase class C family)
MRAEPVVLRRHTLLLAIAAGVMLCGCAGTPASDTTATGTTVTTPPPSIHPDRSARLALSMEFMRQSGFLDSMTRSWVDTAMKPIADTGKFSGAVVLGQKGRIIHERGIGLANREHKLAFTPDTASDAASLAKTFTAAAVHLLVAEGKLDLDAPVQRHLPDYPDAATTLRHLITHSNGLPDYAWFDPHFPKDAVRQSADLLAVLAREKFKPAFTPGTRFVYGNVGFDMAGLVVERVSGQPFASFIQQRFFDPLGMKNSFARPARFADWPGVRTLAYRAPPRESELNDVYDGEGFIGASNLYLTARDLHRWVSAFATGKGLPAAVFDAATQPVLIDGRQSGIRAGNWYCAGASTAARCYYTGSLNGFYSFAYWDRSNGDTFVYVSNSSFQGADAPALDRTLLIALALTRVPLLRGMPMPALPPAGAKDAPAYIEVPEPLEARLVGTYAAGPQKPGLQITRSDDGKRLRLQLDGGLVYDMFRITPTLFYVPGLDMQAGFSGTADAPVLHLRNLLVDLDARRI